MMFNAEAAGYTRRRLVPCFDAFYGSAIRALELAEPGPVRVVLDLGDGHGRPCGDGRRRTPGGAADAARWRAGHGGEGGGDSRATRCRGARSGLLRAAACGPIRRSGVVPGHPPSRRCGQGLSVHSCPRRAAPSRCVRQRGTGARRDSGPRCPPMALARTRGAGARRDARGVGGGG